MAVSRSLSSLNLWYNNIGLEGAKVLALTSVTATPRRLCRPRSKQLTQAGIEALSVGLKESKSLATPQPCPAISKEPAQGCKVLASAIAVMGSLTADLAQWSDGATRQS